MFLVQYQRKTSNLVLTYILHFNINKNFENTPSISTRGEVDNLIRQSNKQHQNSTQLYDKIFIVTHINRILKNLMFLPSPLEWKGREF